MPQYYMGFIHERNPPDVLLSCALEAERSGFDGIARSDHFSPGGSRGTPARRNLANSFCRPGFLGRMTTIPCSKKPWSSKARPQQSITPENWHDPREMHRRSVENTSSEDFTRNNIVSSDPEVHVERLRQVEKRGATIISCANFSGPNVMEAVTDVREQSTSPLADAVIAKMQDWPGRTWEELALRRG